MQCRVSRTAELQGPEAGGARGVLRAHACSRGHILSMQGKLVCDGSARDTGHMRPSLWQGQLDVLLW